MVVTVATAMVAGHLTEAMAITIIRILTIIATAIVTTRITVITTRATILAREKLATGIIAAVIVMVVTEVAGSTESIKAPPYPCEVREVPYIE